MAMAMFWRVVGNDVAMVGVSGAVFEKREGMGKLEGTEERARMNQQLLWYKGGFRQMRVLRGRISHWKGTMRMR